MLRNQHPGRLVMVVLKMMMMAKMIMNISRWCYRLSSKILFDYPHPLKDFISSPFLTSWLFVCFPLVLLLLLIKRFSRLCLLIKRLSWKQIWILWLQHKRFWLQPNALLLRCFVKEVFPNEKQTHLDLIIWEMHCIVRIWQKSKSTSIMLLFLYILQPLDLSCQLHCWYLIGFFWLSSGGKVWQPGDFGFCNNNNKPFRWSFRRSKTIFAIHSFDILEMAFSPAFVWPVAGTMVGWRELGKPVVLTTVVLALAGALHHGGATRGIAHQCFQAF